MRLAAALLATLGLVGCGPRDIVVADVPPNLDGGFERPARRCATDPECGPDGFCDRLSCGALFGTCRRRPVFCDARTEPSCGCDGLTYWNDCLRARAGVVRRDLGECTAPVTCAADAGCPAPASCARLYDGPLACMPGAFEGACWVLPPTCPPGPSSDGWQACGGPGCVNTCEAIRSERPHARRAACP